MKRVWIVIGVVVLLLASTATAVAAGPRVRPASAKPCQAKIVTLQGHVGMKFCGPATAKVTVGGHTYTFTGGFCADDVKDTLALQLSLGWDIPTFSGKPNVGKPLFDLGVRTTDHTGKLLTLDVGGRKLVPNNTPVQSVFSGTLALKGTFRGNGVSGSWSCDGEMYNLNQP